MKVTAMYRLLCALCFLSLSFGTAHAEIVVSVFQGKPISVTKNGVTMERVVPITTMVPGETVVYRYDIHNTAASPAGDVMVKTAIPENTTYLANSAAVPGWTVLVSHDGEQHARESELVITEIDETSRPAAAADIRYLRWTLHGQLGSQEVKTVEFRSTINR